MSKFAGRRTTFNPGLSLPKEQTALVNSCKDSVDPLPPDLDRWEDTDPATWPAEWADVPIPYRVVDPTRGASIPPRALKRRGFLALLGLGTGLAGSVVSGDLAVASSPPGPLARLARRLDDAQRATLAAYRMPLPDTDPDGSRSDTEGNDAFEAWQGGFLDAEYQARRDLASAIATAAGYVAEPLPDDRNDAQHLPLAVVREGRFLFCLVISRMGSRHLEDVRPVNLIPVVVDLGGVQ